MRELGRLGAEAVPISRVLVCCGHLCECQEAGGGARALLKDLGRVGIEAEATPCLGMCGMGAMGCVEYSDGSETLTHSRDAMLETLAVTVADDECEAKSRELSKLLVCTGRVCAREALGGEALLEALRQAIPDSQLADASPCLGSCGQGARVCLEYSDGCEEVVSGKQAVLEALQRREDDRARQGVRSGARSRGLTMRVPDCARHDAVIDQYEALDDGRVTGLVGGARVWITPSLVDDTTVRTIGGRSFALGEPQERAALQSAARGSRRRDKARRARDASASRAALSGVMLCFMIGFGLGSHTLGAAG